MTLQKWDLSFFLLFPSLISLLLFLLLSPMYYHFLSFFLSFWSLSLIFFLLLLFSIDLFLFSSYLLSSPLFSLLLLLRSSSLPSLFFYLFLISSYSAEDIVARDGYRLLSSLFMQIACLGVEEKIMLLKVSIVCNMINWNILYCDLIWFSSCVLYNDMM